MSRYSDSYTQLADFGKELLYKSSIEEGLPHISKYAKDIIRANRCSIFMYDSKQNTLWTTIADGVEKIVIDASSGLAGETIKLKKPIIENNAYSNPHFLSEVDRETGYRTKSVITAPIFDSKRKILGILQLLNKDGGFDNEDARFMIFFAHYISGFLELVNLCEMNNKKVEF